MGRTVVKSWRYRCDHTDHDGRFACTAQVDVRNGQACETGRGLRVNDQADADEVLRSDGWTIGRRMLCPWHRVDR